MDKTTPNSIQHCSGFYLAELLVKMLMEFLSYLDFHLLLQLSVALKRTVENIFMVNIL